MFVYNWRALCLKKMKACSKKGYLFGFLSVFLPTLLKFIPSIKKKIVIIVNSVFITKICDASFVTQTSFVKVVKNFVTIVKW